MRLSLVYKFGFSSVFLMLFSGIIVASIFYTKTTDILVDNALTAIAKDISHAGEKLISHIETLSDDTLFLAGTPPMQGILRARNKAGYDKSGHSSYQQWVDRLEVIFSTVLKSKRDYLRIRLLDRNGHELVSVGHENGKIIKFRGDNLQSKATRRYFSDALKLQKGKLYISEINLNREFGKIIQPHQEVIRTATAIYDERTNQLAAVLVLTTDIGHELTGIQYLVSALDSGSNIYITNDRGSYLLHPDKTKTYGFDLGKQYRIQEDIPQLAKLFVPGNEEQKFILRANDFDGVNVINFSKIPIDNEHPDRFITVGITQQYSNIVAKQSKALDQVLLLATLFALPAILIALFYAHLLTKPIKRITKFIDDYTHSRKSNTTLPVEQNDEVGLMAKSFENMIAEISESEVNLKSLNKTLESRVAERTLKLDLSEKRQRSIVENIVDGLITINQEGIIESFNPAAEKIFGYKISEISGQNFKILMPGPSDSEQDLYLGNYHSTHVKAFIGTGQDVTGLKKDGSTFPMEFSVSEMIVDGETMYTGIVRDITERKQMDKMKNEFISTVSHELRTPLTSIRGSLGLVLGGAVGELPAQTNEMLKIASNNTERLLLLINDILDIQKIESGQMIFKFQNLEVMPFLEQVIEDNAAYGDLYNVKFRIAKSLPYARVYADKDRLSQVLANLLSNAAKFSSAGDVVEISVAKHHDNFLRISVTDFGSGIPEAFQPKLFERFTQSDSSDTRSKGGTGLGLSITREIVEKHGGNIGFVSREGIGSTFYIELPELIGEMETDGEPAPRDLSFNHIPCILIVEDDPDVAMILKRMLAEAGYNSDIAYNTVQARQKLKANPAQFKAITLDLVLPGEDGLSLLEELRSQAATHDIPVIVVSVKADEAKRSLIGGAVGIVDWVQKPVDQQRLINAAKQAAATNRLPRVLHVEDEIDVHKIVSMILRSHCDLTWTTSLLSSKEALLTEKFDLVLLDINLPDGSGLDLLDTIKERVIPPRVVIFSAYDVTEEHAKQVSAVLMKSETTTLELAELINKLINNE